MPAVASRAKPSQYGIPRERSPANRLHALARHAPNSATRPQEPFALRDASSRQTVLLHPDRPLREPAIAGDIAQHSLRTRTPCRSDTPCASKPRPSKSPEALFRRKGAFARLAPTHRATTGGAPTRHDTRTARSPARPGHANRRSPGYFFHFSRKLLATTLTLLSAMAAPAIMGLSKKPFTG